MFYSEGRNKISSISRLVICNITANEGTLIESSIEPTKSEQIFQIRKISRIQSSAPTRSVIPLVATSISCCQPLKKQQTSLLQDLHLLGTAKSHIADVASSNQANIKTKAKENVNFDNIRNFPPFKFILKTLSNIVGRYLYRAHAH